MPYGYSIIYIDLYTKNFKKEIIKEKQTMTNISSQRMLVSYLKRTVHFLSGNNKQYYLQPNTLL